MQRYRAAVLLALAGVLGAIGCGKDGRALTTPTPVPTATSSPAPSAPTTMSEIARTYLDALISTVESNSIKKARIDWAGYRADVLAAAGTAQTVIDLYPAIAVALRLLDDTQTYYTARGGTLIGPPPVGGCDAATPAMPSLPDTVAYVKIGGCDCAGSAVNEFAESIQRAIRAADRPGLDGWIVDLRGNFGGNMWPMIAGAGPVLGEAIVGYITYVDREYEREYRNGAAISFGEAFAQVAVPYTLLRESPRVAVLTDGNVSSAGEAMVVFFRGRPDTRSFGTPTCGHHHLQEHFRLSDSATLSLAISQHADRTKVQYAGAMIPDETIADPIETVNRAVAWLRR